MILAEYCNAAFYNKTLRIMTNTDRLRRPGGARNRSSIRWSHCTGPVVGASSGCYSPVQIRAIIAELKQLIEDGFAGTVGVVTPFRAHKDRLQDAIAQELTSQIPRDWRFAVDTVDGFQGDERDVILFSLVGGDGLPDGSARFIASNPNRFNVAVSRARSVLHVVGDRDWAK